MLAKKAAQKAPRKPRSVNVDLIAVPARVRRSTRVEGKPAVNYSDNVLDLADGHGSRKARQASYPGTLNLHLAAYCCHYGALLLKSLNLGF